MAGDRFQVFTNLASVGVFEADGQGACTYVNQKWEALTGADASTALGWGWTEFLHPDDRERITSGWRRTIAEGGRFEGDLRLTSRHEPVWIEVSAFPTRDGAGAITGFVGTFVDVTARRKAEEEAQAARAEAERTSEIKSRFVANISHELRTPLNGVLGMAGLLMQSPLTSEQREWVKALESSGQALLAIINDVLDLSKIEAGRLRIERIAFSVIELMEQVAIITAPRAHDKGVELLVDIDPSVPSQLNGDPLRLRQIVANLLDNAVKFTEKGEICLSARWTDGDLHIAVRDTGPGIAADRRQAVFLPFVQGDDSTTRRHGGTGLGLAICRELAHAMGGQLRLEQTAGMGSTFTVSLPMSVAMEQPTGEQALPGLAGRRVLVVDDNAAAADLCCRHLSWFGTRADSRPDAVRGFDALLAALERGEPYDALIVDQSLPGIDGISLGKRIAAHPRLSFTPRILLTLATNTDPAARLLRTGFRALLPKPLSRQALGEALAEALECRPSLSARSASKLPPAPELPSLHVLLVEDQPVSATVTRAILENQRHVVRHASSGVAAIEAFATDEFDVVFMDLQMPGMDGFAATWKLREIDAARGAYTPVVAFTANALAGDEERCLLAGLDLYLTKPVEPEALATLLHRCARISGPTFDRADLERRLGGSRPLVSRVLGTFIQHKPQLVADLMAAKQGGDLNLLCHQAHLAKGACASIGGVAASRAAMGLESAAREGNLPQVADWLELLIAELNRIARAAAALG